MRTSLKVTIAAALVAIVVGVFALTAMGGEDPGAERSDGGAASGSTGGGSDGSTGDGVTGDGMAMCIEGVPDCDDMVVNPDGDQPVSHDAGDDPVVDPPQAQLVEPNPDAVDLRARPFDTATVGDDGRTITVEFVSGVEPCYVLGDVEVRQGPNAVTITLSEGHLDTEEDVACIDIGVFKQTIVTLDAPLGDREIVDGAAA